LPIVPSATLSPSWGIVTFATLSPPDHPGSTVVPPLLLPASFAHRAPARDRAPDASLRVKYR
jgi:hypothetical protein